MPGQDAESRKRGRIEKRGNSLRVRVYAGDDPVTGRRVYRNETVRGTDRAAEKRAQKVLTRAARRGGRAARPDVHGGAVLRARRVAADG
jgi:hypothetical protein